MYGNSAMTYILKNICKTEKSFMRDGLTRGHIFIASGLVPKIVITLIRCFMTKSLPCYFVPNKRSPASPRPGTMYPFSLSFSSNAAI